MTRRTLFISFAAGIKLVGSIAHAQKRDKIRDRQRKLIGTIVHRRDGVRSAATPAIISARLPPASPQPASTAEPLSFEALPQFILGTVRG